MTAFDEAWTLLKELSPSAQIMQDNARETLENRGSGAVFNNPIYGTKLLSALQPSKHTLVNSEGKCDICGKQAPLYVSGADYGAGGVFEPSLCKDCQIDRDLTSRTYG